MPMNRGRVYVAGPYTSDPVADVQAAIDTANRLAELGFAPFVPHFAQFLRVALPEINGAFLPLCDALLRIPGDSAGVDQEVAMAVSRDIPVFLSVEALDDHFDI